MKVCRNAGLSELSPAAYVKTYQNLTTSWLVYINRVGSHMVDVWIHCTEKCPTPFPQ